MTTRDRPTPPAALDQNDRERLAQLENRDATQLRAVGIYLEELAAWKESKTDEQQPTPAADPTASGEDSAADELDVEYPDDVPERASVTIKEIASTTYYYYQWRDGDRIESKTVHRD